MATETQALPTKADTTTATVPPKRSAVEMIKETSRQLRGTIALELVKDADHFPEQDKQLLKFHGTYQQEDRDARKNRKKEGVGKYHMFMVRCKIPGGRLTAKQYLAVDDLAGQYANGTLRLTTRQGIQLHGVLKSHLKDTIAGINACLLSTLGACGDVERNVMACPAPHADGLHEQLQETARVLAQHLAPRSRAYHEIWLNGKPIVEDEQAVTDLEPLYGKTYLPRKFKTGLALPTDNCIDIYAQDLGLLAVVENGVIVGYNVLVGGGMGMTHGNANTFPHLARPICYVPAGAVVGAAEAVVRLFRDHGNRADRKRARIKYLVHDWGVEKFRDVLAGYVGGTLQQPRPVEVTGVDPHLGWHEQGDGKWFYGVSVENGRVKDEGRLRLRTGLRMIIEHFQPGVRITPMQDILLCDLEADARADVEKLLAEHGVTPAERLSTVQKFSMACPAVPTCGLAISEAERVLPKVIDQVEEELRRLGLENERLSVRMTGCPNGCARPYQADVGLVGRSGDKYTIFLGGDLKGNRLNFHFKDLVPRDAIVPTLVPLFEDFKTQRRPGEGFGDYCQRLGQEKLEAIVAQAERKAETVEPPFEAVFSPENGVAAEKAPAVNGNGHHTAPATAERSALVKPQVQAIPLALPEPEVTLQPPAPPPVPLREDVLAGARGEERRDYSFHFDADGNVRTTTVYFYGGDVRAKDAPRGLPLVRQAVYAGRVDAYRLHTARKKSDVYYVGPAGHERKDRRVDYRADGTPARTVVFFYGDARAKDAPAGAALLKQVTYAGKVQV